MSHRHRPPCFPKPDKRSFRLCALAFCLLAILPSALSAKVYLDVKAGFEGAFRPGRWSPVFVTVQSDKPMQAVVEMRVANASATVMEIQQVIGIGENKQTYVLYGP